MMDSAITFFPLLRFTGMQRERGEGKGLMAGGPTSARLSVCLSVCLIDFRKYYSSRKGVSGLIFMLLKTSYMTSTGAQWLINLETPILVRSQK